MGGPITEQGPEWVNNRVEWHIESDIYPETFDDEHMLGLLQRPDDAFEHFKDALLGTNDESQSPPSIEKGCTALEIEMTKVNEDIHTSLIRTTQIANKLMTLGADDNRTLNRAQTCIIFSRVLTKSWRRGCDLRDGLKVCLVF